MKAVTLGTTGAEISDIDPPSPQSHQVLVKVRGCGLNRSDLLETQGQNFGHTGGETKVLGGEFAGEIVELGREEATILEVPSPPNTMKVLQPFSHIC